MSNIISRSLAALAFTVKDTVTSVVSDYQTLDSLHGNKMPSHEQDIKDAQELVDAKKRAERRQPQR